MAGFMELVPLIVSALVLLFIIGYVDQFIRPSPLVDGKPWDFPGIGLLVAIVVFYIIGLVVSTRAGRTVMEWKNAVLNVIPVVKTIYGVTQQATKSVSSQFGFTRVVFLEWPREGMVAMGFVTGACLPGQGCPGRRRRTSIGGGCVHTHRPQSNIGESGVRHGRRPVRDRYDRRECHEAGVLRRYSIARRGVPGPAPP